MSEFSQEQYDMGYRPNVRLHYWYLARNRILEKEIKRLNSGHKPILEIGCGPGFVLQHLRAKGFDCTGVELANVKPLPGLESHIKGGLDFKDMPESDRKRIQVVLLLDVIEHIENDSEFLRNVVEAFCSLRHILISVPARKEIWSNYDEYYGHFRRYDSCGLSDLLLDTGFRPIRIQYGFHATYLAARSLKWLRINRVVKWEEPKGIFISLHRIMAFFFRTEKMICPSFLPGSSLFASAERVDDSSTS